MNYVIETSFLEMHLNEPLSDPNLNFIICQGPDICSAVHETLDHALTIGGRYEISGVLNMGWVSPKHLPGKIYMISTQKLTPTLSRFEISNDAYFIMIFANRICSNHFRKNHILIFNFYFKFNLKCRGFKLGLPIEILIGIVGNEMTHIYNEIYPSRQCWC